MTKINKQLPAALMLAVIAGLTPAVAMADAFGSTDPVGVQATTSQRVDKLERELREAKQRNEAQAAAAAKDLAEAKAQFLKAAKVLKLAKDSGEELHETDASELTLPYEVVGQFNNATLIRQDGKTIYMAEKDFLRFKAKEEAKARALLAPPVVEQPLAEVPAPLAAPAAASAPAAGAVSVPQVSPPVPPSIKPKGPISTNPPGPVAATPVPAAAKK